VYRILTNEASAMFEKLEVNNMTQALLFTQNHRIIVEEQGNQKKQGKQPKPEKK